MANLREIKRRIKSAKNISQITKAMQLVASSRMRKAQLAAINSRPYTLKLLELAQSLNIASGAPVAISDSVTILLITTNKGQVGGLNTKLFKHVLLSHLDAKFVTVGKKGEAFLNRTNFTVLADFSQNPQVSAIAKYLIELKSGTVYLAYNRFVSSLVQEPTISKLLPVTISNPMTTSDTILVEPSRTEVSEQVFDAYIENQIHHALLESKASEYSARMMAMKQATDAANDFIKSLNLEYNTARQSAITSEIADLVTARMSVV